MNALPLPATPARYSVRITHLRRDPLRYGFQHRSAIWLVDLDRLPRLAGPLARLCRFDSRDHLGDGSQSIRTSLDQWFRGLGVHRPDRILMLASPRVLGYAFNPLTLFYCYDEHARLRHVVAEVSNTAGEQHRYLLAPDGNGRATADKAFYVSPFHPVGGRYEIYVPAPAATLTVVVTLHRPGARPFTATMTGRRRRAHLWTVLATPLAPRAVMTRIRRHGIALYLKGLRPTPRPEASR